VIRSICWPVHSDFRRGSYPGTNRPEPVTSDGPGGLLPTTFRRGPGASFLADAHAFGGNSGSPVFVDPTIFGNALYHATIEMVVSSAAWFPRTQTHAQRDTTISGNLPANSGVSVVGPAFEPEALAGGPDLKEEREISCITAIPQSKDNPNRAATTISDARQPSSSQSLVVREALD